MERSNFIDIQKQVQILDNLFQEHINNVKEATNVYSQFASVAKTTFPSEVIKNAKDIDAISAKLATTLSRQARVHTALNKEVASGYVAAQKKIQLERTQLTLQQQKDRLNAKELQRLEQLNNAYNRISELMKRATAEYNNLAARKNFGIQLTQKEEARYTQLQARIERFNKTLKQTDFDIGKYGRNVANYGTQWDGLRFQTNQLIRELPAMAYGANVFFGAIGNNLPMFVDEVKKARVEQKLAIEQGKQAPSVLSRVTGALFNWQTALVLGITYLTLHGKEVIEWVKNLLGASTALEELTKRQKDFNNAQLQGRKDAQAEIIELRKNIAVIQDKTIADDLRITALKQLREQYPRYFKDLKDEEIGTWKSGQAVYSLIEALEKRKEVEKKTELNVQNRQRLIDLENELDVLNKSIPELEKTLELRKEMARGDAQFSGAIQTVQGELNSAERRRNTLLEEQKRINDDIINNEQNIIQLRKETIALDWREEKDKKEKTKANYEYIDSLASEYELMKLLYEIEIERNKNIFEDEKATYSERGKAMKEMYDNQLALIKLTRDEEIRLLDLEKAKNLEEVKNATDKNRAIFEIEQDYSNKLSIIRQNYSKQETEINNEIAKSYDVVIKQQWEYLKNLNDINQLEQNRSSSNVAFLEKATFKTILKDYEDYENKKNEIAEDAQKERINLRLAELEIDLASNRYSADDYQKLQSEKIQLEKELANIQQKNAEEHAKRILELARKYKSFFNDVIRDAYGSFPSLYDFIHGGFSEMLDQSGKMVSEYQEQIHSLEGTLESLREAGEEGSQEYNDALSDLQTTTQNLSQLQVKMALSVAVQVTEIFQDMYNLMQQNADAYFQRQFELLEMQKDIAIKNAGESTVAREEIDRQYEEKRRQIERERAKQQKEQAMFNAVINLAQGIMSTIAQLGFPAAIPMIALVSAIGAVQIGMIASQPLPAYAEGTNNHIGGAMLVNDGNGSNYRETVVTPDGKIIKPQGRNVLMNAPKGTQVFTHDQWQKKVGSILNGDKNQYNYPVNNGITKEDLKEILSEQSRYNNQGDKFEVNIDRQGINATIIRGATKVKKLNSRIRIKRNK